MASSNIFQNIQQQSPANKLAFIDVDHTLTANPWETEEKDLLDSRLTNQAMALLKKAGYCCILNTSRTEEMCMSSKQYMLSKQYYHFKRPAPQIGMGRDGRRFYIKPEDFYPINFLDLPIIISSSGAKISVLQNEGGYREDTDFYPAHFPSLAVWREKTISILHSFNLPFRLSPIESTHNYYQHVTDVFPPDYRIQLYFRSLHELIQFTQKIKSQKNNFFLTNDSDPEKQLYTLYITPKKGKYEVIEHIVNKINISEILIIGDSLPDLEAGLHTYSPEIKKTFLLVGGSRLTSYLIDAHKTSFAGINLNVIKKQLSSFKNKYIIGDLAFPKAIGPRSIIEFLS